MKLLINLNTDELKNLIDESVINAISKFPQKPEVEILLKRIDVAKLFGISLVTLNSWMKDGRIHYHRINSRIFFKHSEVMEALTSVKKYMRK